jgi:hypothetical protein
VLPRHRKADERYLVSGKSKFNEKDAIEQLPFIVSDISSAYICRQCLAKLQDQAYFRKKEPFAVLTSVYRKGKHKYTLGIFSSETSSSFLLYKKFFNFDSSSTIICISIEHIIPNNLMFFVFEIVTFLAGK